MMFSIKCWAVWVEEKMEKKRILKWFQELMRFQDKGVACRCESFRSEVQGHSRDKGSRAVLYCTLLETGSRFKRNHHKLWDCWTSYFVFKTKLNFVCPWAVFRFWSIVLLSLNYWDVSIKSFFQLIFLMLCSGHRLFKWLWWKIQSRGWQSGQECSGLWLPEQNWEARVTEGWVDTPAGGVMLW